MFEPKGSASKSLSWNEVDTKYRSLMPASGLPEIEIELSLTLLHDFRHLSDVSRLATLLRVGTG